MLNPPTGSGLGGIERVSAAGTSSMGAVLAQIVLLAQIGGFDLIECKDLDEAIEVASKHPMATFGTIEVRPFWTE